MGRIREIVEEKSEATTKKGRKTSEKGKGQPEAEDVTRSSSSLTSEMMSPQEVVVTEPKKDNKAKKEQDSLESYSASSRLKQFCSKYTSSGKEPTPKSKERKTKSHEKMTVEENDNSTFEFSKRLVALAREKQTQNRKRRRSEPRNVPLKRKASSSYGHSVTKRNGRQSQSQSYLEEVNDLNSLAEAQQYEHKLMRVWSQYEGKMKLRSAAKMWSTELLHTAPLDYEFSRRLQELSRKRKRYQPEEHAHCCRCVQSFECFWPRSNLQTIRRQAFC